MQELTSLKQNKERQNIGIKFSGFNLFLKEKYAEYKDKYPDLEARKIRPLLGKEWQDLSYSKKSEYHSRKYELTLATINNEKENDGETKIKEANKIANKKECKNKRENVTEIHKSKSYSDNIKNDLEEKENFHCKTPKNQKSKYLQENSTRVTKRKMPILKKDMSKKLAGKRNQYQSEDEDEESEDDSFLNKVYNNSSTDKKVGRNCVQILDEIWDDPNVLIKKKNKLKSEIKEINNNMKECAAELKIVNNRIKEYQEKLYSYFNLDNKLHVNNLNLKLYI